MYRKRNVPSDPQELPQFLDQELRNIEQAQQAPVPFLVLAPQHKEPPKLTEGLVVYADGTDWNPGSGKGVYRYSGAAWAFLG